MGGAKRKISDYFAIGRVPTQGMAIPDAHEIEKTPLTLFPIRQ